MADHAKAPATSTQNLPYQDTGKAKYPVDPAKRAAITGGSVDDKDKLPLGKIKAVLDAVRDGHSKLTLDMGKQNPSVQEIFEANKDRIVETCNSLAKFGKAFDATALPLPLRNSQNNALWTIAEEILKNPSKYGVTNGFQGWKSFKPMGPDSGTSLPKK